MDRVWTGYKQGQYRQGKEGYRQGMDSLWTGYGQGINRDSIDRAWTGHGQGMDRAWMGIDEYVKIYGTMLSKSHYAIYV